MTTVGYLSLVILAALAALSSNVAVVAVGVALITTHLLFGVYRALNLGLRWLALSFFLNLGSLGSLWLAASSPDYTVSDVIVVVMMCSLGSSVCAWVGKRRGSHLPVRSRNRSLWEHLSFKWLDEMVP